MSSKGFARTASAVLLAAAVAGAAMAGEGGKKPKEVTKTGEIIDLSCYAKDGKQATGEKHKDCATSCINGGAPVGLLTKDGTVYLLIAADHGDTKGQLVQYAAAKVKVTGTTASRGGMKVLTFTKVEPAPQKK